MKIVQFFCGGGPTIAIALEAKSKATTDGKTEIIKIPFRSDSNEPYMQRLEYGINIISGIETKLGLLFAINYNLGLNNITSIEVENYGKLTNRYLAFKIGYLLRKKR